MTVGSLGSIVQPSARHPLFALLAVAVAAMASAGPCRAADDARLKQRAEMVSEIAAIDAGAGVPNRSHGIAPRVMAVMGEVPRHEFVPDPQKPHAYENRPLPIGHGQTISQPYIVALMTDLLRVQPGDSVLEIGTGSGYQAAVLSQLARAVYTIEIIEPLGRQACERLQRLAYRQVACKVGDGYYGWDEHAPYDAIVVTAAASHVPPPLIRQLKPGGRMVIPVGAQFLTQYLLLVEKAADGAVTTRQILPVRFVPLVGKH
ncbi:protein-L-isoaspartate(D-aspartate) O-methyltransferase [Cupriavidus sp. MP-37]|uniref:protein-L-isoaspartate(D-aspartate) O-methyltransferase n=1 Tax=Cupriavidus sp. MP-37 TaxID=2884455 RepID=UPI001D0A6641|nr:protein-L-isoaspartate(D-aspartate) O-methyltransferase [Cupriavidus sp. MP-37]UDM49022.1 protein-L-isoaspartate(D-aspartate) O-methyltransferase [Cupriavidus sp. MP-37]